MKRFIFAAVAVCGLTLSGLIVHAADATKDAKATKTTGVLIDNSCGGKQKNETTAASHKKACAMKEACAASGYQVIHGTKHLKLNDKGNELAKEYLANNDNTHVVVEGTIEGDTLNATSIAAAAGGSGGKTEPHGGDKVGGNAAK